MLHIFFLFVCLRVFNPIFFMLLVDIQGFSFPTFFCLPIFPSQNFILSFFLICFFQRRIKARQWKENYRKIEKGHFSKFLRFKWNFIFYDISPSSMHQEVGLKPTFISENVSSLYQVRRRTTSKFLCHFHCTLIPHRLDAISNALDMSNKIY